MEGVNFNAEKVQNELKENELICQLEQKFHHPYMKSMLDQDILKKKLCSHENNLCMYFFRNSFNEFPAKTIRCKIEI